MRNKELASVTVTKGSARNLERWNGVGWLLSVYAYTTDPYMQVKLTVDGDELPSETIYNMNLYGETQPGGLSGFILKYASGYYSIQLVNPNRPEPFRQKVELNAVLSKDTSNATAPVTVVTTYLEIIDMAKFRKSLDKLKGLL